MTDYKMKVSIELEDKQIEAIMLNELKEQYQSIIENIEARKNGLNVYGMFVAEKEEDIREMKRHLDAFDTVIDFNSTRGEYNKWKRGDIEDNIVIKSLKDYYESCAKPNRIDNSDDIIEPDETILNAIDRVLQDYMPPDDYSEWKNEKGA